MQSVTQGTAGLDYTITTDGCSGPLNGLGCSIVVAFTPTGAGTRTGAAEAVGSSTINDLAPPAGVHPRVSTAQRPRDQPPGTVLATALLHGIGLAPVGVFNTAPISTSGLTPLPGTALLGIASVAVGDLYVTDPSNCVVQKYSGNVTTVVAGTSCGPSSGDGGPATSAVMSDPIRTAIDGAGNLYITDNDVNAVRKVSALTGIISTVAGTGSFGYTGDGGPATSATFQNIVGIALDSAGNEFITDAYACVVRRVDAVSGIINTVAGNGTCGYSGDGGPATSGELNFPFALAINSAGKLYIGDTDNYVVREVSGGVISTVAGNGTAGYSGDGGPASSAELTVPLGLAVDPAGNVYIEDSGNDLLRKLDAGTGIISTVAGTLAVPAHIGDGGQAIKTTLGFGYDVAVTADGSLFIADTQNQVVRTVSAGTAIADFGSILTGSSSAAQDTVFSNVGTSSLSVSALQVPSNFNLAGANTTCTGSSTVAANAGCVLGIEFAPTANGPLSGTLTVSDNTGNAPAAGQLVELSGTGTTAAAAKLAFAGSIPGIAAGGNLGAVTVDVQDVNGALVAGATSVVTLSITGPNGYSQNVTVTAINGVASFDLSSLVLTTTGSYTLTATSPSLTLAQAGVSVTGGVPNMPAQLAFASPVPSSIAAGSNLGIVPVAIDDSSHTLVAGATNSVTLTITGPGGYSHALTVAAVGGVAGFDLSALGLTTPGTYTLTATSPGLAQITAAFRLTASAPGMPEQLSIASTVPATLASGGNLGIVPVTLQDFTGAVVMGATNSVTLTVTGPGGFSYSVTVIAVNGIASFDLSALSLSTPGTYTLTATSGHLSTAIATVTVTSDFTIVVSVGTAASSIIPPGAPAGFNFTLAPASGSFPLPIALTATGLPGGATYSFSPTAVTPGSGSAATAMAIQTLRNDSAAIRTGLGTTVLALLLLPLSVSRRMRKMFRGRAWPLGLALFALASLAGLAGCGAGGLFGQPQQSYTITVTGTSGAISHSATVTLTVE